MSIWGVINMKKISILIISALIFSSVSIMFTSNNAKAESASGTYGPIILLPWVDHKVTVNEEDYADVIKTRDFDMYYVGEINDFTGKQDIDKRRIELKVTSFLKNPCGVPLPDFIPGRKTTYKITHDEVLFSQDARFEDGEIFVDNAEELYFSIYPSMITGVDRDGYNSIYGLDAEQSHWVHIKAPRENDDQETTPGYYGYKIHIWGDGAFVPLWLGEYERDIYIVFGHKLDQIPPPEDDEDPDGDNKIKTKLFCNDMFLSKLLLEKIDLVQNFFIKFLKNFLKV